MSTGTSNEDDRLELFFSQSLDGFFFMMLDEPIAWNDEADKEALLDYALDHHRVTKANDAMLRQYGATREQFIGITPRQLFAHDLAYGRRVWRSFFDRGRHVETEEGRIDGDPVFIEGDYICFYDGEGRITGHFGIQRDVTERRRAVEQRERELEMLVAARTAELAISEHRLRAILSALPDLVFLVDEDGRYLEILSAASPLLARSAEELKGRLFHDIFAKPAADAFLTLVRATLQAQAMQTMEYQLTVPAGDRWFEGRTAVLPVDITEKRCVVFTARDISDTKRAEELESQTDYLREELNLGRSYGDIVGAQFRPTAPPEPGSPLAMAEIATVQRIGGTTSRARTAEQTEISKFWYENSTQGWNRIAHDLAVARQLDSWAAARLLALVNVAMADGFIGGFEAKYHYNYWRPATVIRETTDPAWLSNLMTPPVPDFPSTHTVLGAAAAAVLERFFETDYVAFAMTSGAPYGGITRRFWSFSEAAQENGASRVLAGIHFPTAVKAGYEQGDRIGAYVFEQILTPLTRPTTTSLAW